MKILDRYVLVSFLKNYLIALMVLLGLYIVLDMVFNFDQLVDVKGMSARAWRGRRRSSRESSIITSINRFSSTRIFSGVIPVVAVAFTLIRLSRFNELSAIMAAGVPLLRMASQGPNERRPQTNVAWIRRASSCVFPFPVDPPRIV